MGLEEREEYVRAITVINSFLEDNNASYVTAALFVILVSVPRTLPTTIESTAVYLAFVECHEGDREIPGRLCPNNIYTTVLAIRSHGGAWYIIMFFPISMMVT